MPPAPLKLQPAFYGGIFIGVLSALPVVSAGNCCCCLWVVSGGLLTTYLMQQNHPYPVQAADGALGGLLAGVFGGIIGVLLAIPITMAMGPYQQRMMERLASNPNLPDQYRGLIENMSRNVAGAVAMRLLFGVLVVAVDAVFGMLGGLLGVALFKRKDVPPAGTTEVLPPA
ncbi:MAG TPA: hypothetical protein VGL62_04225 [Vicinamibacterales bacterium]|jgi:hypothetical protein